MKRWAWINLIKFFNTAGVLIALVAGGSALLYAPTALAIQPNCSNGPYIDYGRYEFCGYFGNKFDANGLRLWDTGVPNSVNSPASFIAFVEAEKNIAGQGQTSAEFVIDTMEGLTPTSVPPNARGEAWTLAADWEHRITAGVAGGTLKINFFQNVSWRCGQEDTYYQVAQNDVAGYITSPATNETPPCGPGVTVPAIVFSNAKTGQVYYVIKRSCGNPIGKLNAIPEPPPPPYALKMTLDPAAGTPAYTTGPNTGIIEPGNTYHLTPTVTNPSNNDATALTMDVDNLTSKYVTNAGIKAGGADVTSDSYKGAGCGSGASPCWDWQYANGLTKNTTSTNTNGVAFTVAAATPQGSTVCFQGYISPSTQVAGSKLFTAKYCFLVYTPIFPAVVGNNGDVHAGGGLCDAATLSDGTVTGYAGAGTGSEYIVSASAAGINNFGSNGAASGAPGDNLLLGQNGAYAQVCREDLLNGPNGANAYYAAGAGFTTVGPGTYNISGWSGVYFINGSATISGTVNSKLTIVERSGTLTIGAPGITLTAASFAINKLPSLGIIAAGDIDINNTVTLVDAYLFADGDINTCVQDNATCATATLVVNGFLVAKDISLQRLGVSTAKGATVAERVNLTPQLYLDPPKFFDSSADNILLEGQGEVQPLF